MRRTTGVLRTLAAALAAAAAAALLLVSVGNVSRGSADKGRERLEEAIRRSAVTCYATEGVYPPTLDYLEEHYGLQVDRARYTVHYDVFAENLMPDITVLENED